MPRRSNVAILPSYIRAEVERRLAENGYRDYRGLTEWVRQQGYHISDDSLWRYGKGVQRQLDATQTAVYQARALAQIGDGDKGVLIAAIKTVVEQKVLTKLTEEEPLSNTDIRLMNATANLLRASVFDQRRTDVISAEGRERKPSHHTASLDAIDTILREALVGIKASAEKQRSEFDDTHETRKKADTLRHCEHADTAALGLARADLVDLAKAGWHRPPGSESIASHEAGRAEAGGVPRDAALSDLPEATLHRIQERNLAAINRAQRDISKRPSARPSSDT